MSKLTSAAVVSLALASLGLGAEGVRAADVSQDAIDACIDQLRAQSSAQGGTVVYTEFSEANSFVVLRDNGGAEWRCVVSNDGRMASIESSGSSVSSGGSSPAPAGPAFWQVRVNGSLNIRQAPSSSAMVVARLPNGMVVENRGNCVDAEGRTWCQVGDGDATGWAALEFLMPSSGGGENTATADDGGGAMAGSGSGQVRVRFAAGTSGAELTGELMPGESVRYLIGASAGQDLYFRLAANGPNMSYQIFNPDGSFLLDQMSADQEYRGQLWQSGDHVVEVINRGNGAQSFNVIFGIQ